MPEKLICSKCQRSRAEKEFFKMKSGERCDLCSDCLTMHIDNYNPSTFTWILEKFNVPYIKNEWIKITNTEYKKNPLKFGSRSVIGRYIRTMNMAQYREYGYADSDKLNFENEKAEQRRAEQQIDEEYEIRLKEQLDNGEISQAQYNTLSKTIDGYEDPNAEFIKPIAVDESKIRDEMSEEEFQYLIYKWGHLYQPSQLVQMEKLYHKYANEYELNVDREETLKKICKTSLKMDEALDIGDTAAYQKLASVFDQLRKAGKFTEAQNKEEQVRYLDSVGELVALCEREGGAIKAFVDPDEYPQDKIDFTLKDLKSYNYNLATNELNLGDLIQSYIEKLEKAEKEDSANLEDGLVTSFEEESLADLTDQEAIEFQEYVENEIEKDAEMLLETFGGE